ncbi:MAG: cobaltochelatase subunit CobN, partial [Planctomycetes bacterium]|nr:cobaltochelatase subunit CobN [Planctomycetota bacterium]
WRVIFILNIAPEHPLALTDAVRDWLAARPGRAVVPLDARDSHGDLAEAQLLRDDPRVVEYWRAGGLDNLRRLLRYTAVTYLDGEGEIEPPAIVPEHGYYHPRLRGSTSDFDEFREKVGLSPDAPVAVIAIHHSFWVTRDTAVIDAEVEALEGQGFAVVVVFADSFSRFRQLVGVTRPSLVVEDRHGSMGEGDGERSLLEELDVPYLRPISMLGSTVDEWRASATGLLPRDVNHFMSLQEMFGTVDPLVVGGLKESVHGFRLHVPIPERVQRFAERARRWVRLRERANAEKRVAIVYYNRGLGKDDLMRGSPTGAFLDAPESLVRFLPRLRAAGYDVSPLPRDAGELLGWIRERAHNSGPWAQAELETMADQPGAVLIDADRMSRWLNEKLDDAQRAAMVEHFGPSPGRLMVVRRNGRPHIVLPGIALGNIWLGCLPLRGEKQDAALLHSRDVPPPYNYLAFYWYLQEEFGADAVIHWGTHGTVELLPGREAGLGADDWGDICVGRLPIINPWITDNIGEATMSRRRSYALLVDHQVPPTETAELVDELRLLHDDIDKFQFMEPGLLREEFRGQISESARGCGLAELLDIDRSVDHRFTDEEVTRLSNHLHAVGGESTPRSLHVLGRPPENDQLPRLLLSTAGPELLEKLAAHVDLPEAVVARGDRETWLRERGEELVTSTILNDTPAPDWAAPELARAREVYDGLRLADLEIERLLTALAGRFVPPGPGPDPIRNPASVPTGRNLYALNPEEIPHPAAWRVAVRLIDAMCAEEIPTKVGLDLNGMNTLRDYGVMEAQALYLMGVRPVWNASRQVVDVEVIPREELKRPRIDLFVAMGGMYKENFPSRVRLLDRAIQLVSGLDEADNRVRQGSERLGRRLRDLGFGEDRADRLATTRIFGTKPGNVMGTNILHLVPRSGVWTSDDEIADVYADNMSFAYSGEFWGVQIDGLYREAIQGTDTLLRVWASNMTSQLSNHHAYEYLGGLSLAVEKLTGVRPKARIADVRDPSRARLRTFEEVLDTSLRTELLHRGWIEGMKEHDYAGAGMIAELVKNSFGWDVTRTDSISDTIWDEIYETYVEDQYDLDLDAWFDRVNPHARQEILATMIEASRKQLWACDEARRTRLCEEYLRSVDEHGASEGLVSGGNQALVDSIEGQLRDSRESRSMAHTPESASDETVDAEKVHGVVLDGARPATEARAAEADRVRDLAVLIGGMVVCFFIGWTRRSGGIGGSSR